MKKKKLNKMDKFILTALVFLLLILKSFFVSVDLNIASQRSTLSRCEINTKIIDFPLNNSTGLIGKVSVSLEEIRKFTLLRLIRDNLG